MRYTFRFPPCSIYDTEGFECWLETMAQKGLLLEPDGFYFGFGKFRKAKPTTMRYRLLPAPRNEQKPADAAIELTEGFGWQFYGKHKDFFLYSSADPNARELHTDSQLHAEAYKTLLKHQILSFSYSILINLWFAHLWFPYGLLWSVLNTELWALLFAAILTTLFIGTALRELVQTARLTKKLRTGSGMTRTSRRWFGYLPSRIFVAVALVVLVLFFHQLIGNAWAGVSTQPVNGTAMDFPTMEAFLPDSQFMDDENPQLAVRSHPLAAQMQKFDQQGSISNGEITADGFLTIYDYAFPNEFLAKWYLKDLTRWCERRWLCDFTPIDTNLDQSLYSGSSWNTLLVQDGSTVFYVQFGQDPDEPYQIDNWANLWLAAYLETKTP